MLRCLLVILFLAMLKKLNNLCVTGGGVGYLPRMPGTYGSLVGLGLIILFRMSEWGQSLSFWQAFYINVFLSLAAWVSIHFAEKKDFGHDDPRIVIDEVVGMTWAILAIAPSLGWQCAGFAIFRVLDITKPSLIGYIDRHLPGALGTLLDDVLAGIITYLCLICLKLIIE